MLWIQYVDECSDALISAMKDLEVEVAFKRGVTLRNKLCSGMKYQPRERDQLDSTGVVYAIPCTSCDVHYIGETGRSLRTRINEHINKCKQGDEKNGPFCHMRATSHRIDFENTMILERVRNTDTRKLVEASVIRAIDPLKLMDEGETMNQDTGRYVHPSWDSVLVAYRERIMEKLSRKKPAHHPSPRSKEAASVFLEQLL